MRLLAAALIAVAAGAASAAELEGIVYNKPAGRHFAAYRSGTHPRAAAPYVVHGGVGATNINAGSLTR